ncbi:protein neprosin-like [Euphorbia lathyris]|uniref:protein neprosin-like n=1 Tax=Euphorbia lathyris TaxID=212925 RepID=UPI003313AB51
MGLKYMILVLFLCFVSIFGDRILSKEEDLELEQELQRLTKPAVETIQTTYGDTYDYVDFYRQPAFDDPLMKNHSFHPQMKPISYHGGRKSKNFTSYFRPEKIWMNGKGCPVGTVPIKKITKHDLFRAKLASEIYASNLNPQTTERPGVHFAVLHTPRLGAKVKYYGAGMHNKVCNPKLNHDSQYSSSQLKLQNGYESIIFGWTVHPRVFGDSKTHFFIYTYANNKHCFNDHCGLFIKTRPDISLDWAYDPVSPTCGPLVRSQELLVQKDEASGNWVLKLTHGEILGMWPSRFFTGLASFATYVEWGGEVYSPSHIASPEMGTGISPAQNGNCCGLCLNLKLVNEDKKIVHAMSLVKYEDVNKYYQVEDRGYTGENVGHVMAYGSKGGYIGNYHQCTTKKLNVVSADEIVEDDIEEHVVEMSEDVKEEDVSGTEQMLLYINALDGGTRDNTFNLKGIL